MTPDLASPIASAILRRAQLAAADQQPDLYFQAALAAECTGSPSDQTLDLFLHAFHLRPQHTPTREAVARLAALPDVRLEQLTDDLIARFDGSIRRNLLLARAERRLQHQDFNNARFDIEDVLREEPGHRPARYLLQQLAITSDANVVLKDNLSALAVHSLDDNLRRWAFYQSAKLAEDLLDDPHAALNDLQQAALIAPQDTNIILATVRCARAADLPEIAAEAFERQARADALPQVTTAAAIEAAALCLERLEQPQRAASLLRVALEQRTGESARALDAVIARELLATATARFNPADELKALRELGPALARGRRQAAVFTRIGQLLLEADPTDANSELALRYLESALDADPAYRPALLLLDELYAEGRFPLKGRDLLRRRGLEQARPDLLVRAADLTLQHLDRPEEAVALLRQAVSLSNDVSLFGPDSPFERLLTLLDQHPDLEHLRAQSIQDAFAVARSEHTRRRLLDLATQLIEADPDADPAELLGLTDTRHLTLTDPHLAERIAALLAARSRWEHLLQLRRAELDPLEEHGTTAVLDAIFEIGLLHDLALHDRDGAISWLRAALDRDPAYAPAQASLEQLLVQTDRWADLAHIYHARSEQQTEDAERASLAFKLAMIAELDPNAAEAALQYYQHVLQTNPYHLPSILGALRIAEALPDPHLRATLLNAWAEREPDDNLASTLFAELAEIAEDELFDLQSAAEAARAALDRAPRHEIARSTLIRALVRLQRPDLAFDAASLLPGLDEADPDEALQLAAGLLLLAPDPRAVAEDILASYPAFIAARLIALRVALTERDNPAAAEHARALAQTLHPGPLQATFASLHALLTRLAGQALDYRDVHLLLQQPSLDERDLLRLEALLRDHGDLESLASLMRRRAEAVTDDLTRASYLLALGRCLQARGHNDEATEVYELILEERPGFLPAVKALKLLYELLGDREGLAIAAEREGALVKDPNLAISDFLTAGEIRRRYLGDIDGAILDLETVIKLQPSHDIAFESLKEIYSLRGQARELYHLMQRRAEGSQDPHTCKDLLLRMAEIAFSRLQDNTLAMRCHQQVLQLDPAHIQSWRILAELHEQNRDWSAAVDCLVGVLGLTEDRNLLAITYKKIADIYDAELQDTPRAIEAFRSLLRHDPNKLDALRRLAVLLHAEHRWEEAAKAYGNLLQRERSRHKLKDDLRALAQICLQGLHDPQRAEQCLQHALRLDLTDLTLHAHLLAFYRDQNDLPRVNEHLQRSARQFATLVLEELEAGEGDKAAAALQGLAQIAEWDEAPDRAFLTAAVGHAFELNNDHLNNLYAQHRDASRLHLPKHPIPIDLTDITLPPDLSASLLHILRYADEPLRRLRSNLASSWGIGRRTRLSDRDSRPGADLLLRWPSLFSLPDVQVHVSPEGPELPVAIPGEPHLLVVHEDALPRIAQGDPELLFHLGRAVAPLSMGVAAWTGLSEDLLLAALVAAVRAYNATWLLGDERATHPHVDEDRIKKLVQRVPERLIMPHLLDVTARFDGNAILRQRDLLDRACTRLALLPIFNPAPVLRTLRQRNPAEAADTLHLLLHERLPRLRSALHVALD